MCILHLQVLQGTPLLFLFSLSLQMLQVSERSTVVMFSRENFSKLWKLSSNICLLFTDANGKIPGLQF
jgi:hypothetical protein